MKEEAKAPVSTTSIDVRTTVKKDEKNEKKDDSTDGKRDEKKESSGCCGGAEKDRGSSEAKGDSCCQSNEVSDLNFQLHLILGLQGI